MFFINSDGSGFEEPAFFEPYLVTSSESNYLAWSSDGRYLAFDGADQVTPCDIPNTDCVTANYGIFVADWSTGVVSPLTEGIGSPRTNPSWSPDVQYLVVPLVATVLDSNGQNRLVVNLFKFALGAEPQSEQPQRLTEELSSDLDPAWSPDGQWITFVRSVSEPPGCDDALPGFCDDRRHTGLYVLRPDGTDLRLLLESLYVEDPPYGEDVVYSAPSWSADSQWLAVLASEEQPAIALVNVASGEVRRLEGLSPVRSYPVWSPDGNRLAFVSQRDGNYEIYTVSPDGTGLVNLTQSPAYDFDPVWSPSGHFIAFTTSEGDGKLYVMHNDGTGRVELGPWAVLKRPAWFPGITPGELPPR